MDPIIKVLLAALGLYLVYALVSIILYKRKQSIKAKKNKITPTKAEANILTKKSKAKVKELKSTDIIVEMRPPVIPQTGKLEINIKKPEPPKTEQKPAEATMQKAAEEKKPDQTISVKVSSDIFRPNDVQPADTPIFELQPIVPEEIVKDYDKHAVSSEHVINEVEDNANKSIDDAVSANEVIEEVESDISQTLKKFDDKNVDDSYSTKHLETDEALGLEDYNGYEDTELDIMEMNDNNELLDEFTVASPLIKTILFGDILNRKQ